MIRSFANRDTEKLWNGESPKGVPPNIRRAAMRKLLVLHAATSLSNLAIVPGNRLEKLVAEIQGQYSIRINDQWRVCFVWQTTDARDVEVCDYH